MHDRYLCTLDMVRLLDKRSELIVDAQEEDTYHHLLSWLVEGAHHYELYADLYSRLGQLSHSSLCKKKALHIGQLTEQYQAHTNPIISYFPQGILQKKLIFSLMLFFIVDSLFLLRVI